MFEKKEKQEVKVEKKAKDEVKQKSKLKANEYRIIVKDPWGNSTYDIKKLVAKRYEYDDGVVVLRNEKLKFEEIFPALDDTYKTMYDKKQLNEKLQKANSKLKKILEGEDKKTNIKNVKYEIFQLEAQINRLKYKTEPAFMTLDDKKDPTFTYLRKGSTYYPLAIDVDTNTIYVPSDYKKKKSAMTVRNKTQKYTKLAGGIMTAGTLIVLICGIVLNAVGGFFMYKGYTYIDSESAMSNLNAKFDNTAANCLKAIEVQNFELAKTSQTITKTSETINDHLVPSTIIDGVKPIDFK